MEIGADKFNFHYGPLLWCYLDYFMFFGYYDRLL